MPVAMDAAARRRYRPDVIAAAGLLLIALAVFQPALGSDVVLFERDIMVHWHPSLETLMRAAAEGWPVWNPYRSFGMPIWQDPNLQIAYPPTWLNLVLSPEAYYKVFALGHCWWAALGLYVFLRALGAGRWAALIGGAVWCLSGPFNSSVSLYHHHSSASWIGWVLFGLVRLLQEVTVLSALRLGGIAGLLALAASAEVIVITAVLCAVMLLASPRGAIGARAGLLGMSVLLAALLAAAQWLPTADYVRTTGIRRSLGTRMILYWSMHPASIADFVVPRLVADMPWKDGPAAALFESREPFLHLYLGASAAALAGLALLGRRDRRAHVTAAAFLLFILVALGRHTWLLPWIVNAGLTMFRYPVKAMFAVALLWSILCALGAQLWLMPWGRRERRGGAAVAVLMVMLTAAIAWAAQALPGGALAALLEPEAAAEAVDGAVLRLRLAALGAGSAAAALLLRTVHEGTRSWSAGLVGGIVLLDLVTAAGGMNVVAPRGLMSSAPAILSHIGPSLDHTRIHSVDVGLRWSELFHKEALAGPALGVRAMWGAVERLQSPIGMRWRLAGSFEPDATGLTPRAITVMSGIVARSVGAPAAVRLLELGAVDFVVSMAPVHSEGLDPVAAVPSPVWKVPVRVYRVARRLPRAYMVGRSRVVSDGDAALAQLLDPAFEPSREVVLAAGEALVEPEAFRGSARIVVRGFRRVAIEVEASRPGYLVLVESFVPGWRATVDGTAVPVLRGNVAFRAIRVPAGSHRVEMSYLPASVVIGVSLSAAAALAALVVWTRSSRRHAAEEAAGAGRI